jgi:hypothetical protein
VSLCFTSSKTFDLLKAACRIFGRHSDRKMPFWPGEAAQRGTRVSDE